MNTRRRLLATAASGSLAGIAGCTFDFDETDGQEGDSDSRDDDTNGDETVVFDGGGAEAFGEALERAAETPGSTLRIEEGTYDLGPDDTLDTDTTHFAAHSFDDLTIDGGGATLVFTDPTRAMIRFTAAAGLEVRDLTVDHDPLPFTQGTITDVDESEEALVLELDEDYPSLDHGMYDEASYVYATTHTEDDEFVGGERIDGPQDKSFAEIDRRDEGVYRLVLDEESTLDGLESERRLAVLARGPAHAFEVFDIDGVTFENVAIRASSEFGTLIRYCADPVLRGVTIAPPPDSDRLLSVNADGAHIRNSRSGPLVEDCRFEYLGDDAVAMSAQLFEVADVLDDRTVEIADGHEGRGFSIEPGDPVAGISAAGERYGTLSRVESVEMGEPQPPESRRGPPPVDTITFEDPIDGTLTPGDCFSNEAAKNEEFAIRDNEFRNMRARVLRLTSGPGLVEDNVLEGSNHSVILIESRTDDHFEPKRWAEDLTIRGNEIRGAGLTYFAGSNPAGIELHHDSTDGEEVTGRPNTTLEIVDNEFIDGAYFGMDLSDAEDLVISGNTLSGLHQLEYDRIAKAGIHLTNVNDVEVTDTVVRGSSDEVERFALLSDVRETTDSGNELVIDDEATTGELVELVPVEVRFDRAVDVDGRHLSFMCFELTLVDDAGDVVRSVDVGDDEGGIEFGDGVDTAETGDDGSFRWFGSADARAVIYAFETDLEDAARLDLYGHPYEEDMSATVEVADEPTDDVDFGPREVETYSFSLE